MQYKIVGDLEQGIHYTRFIEEVEDEEQATQKSEGLEDGRGSDVDACDT
jgi:hypothetical protein